MSFNSKSSAIASPLNSNSNSNSNNKENSSPLITKSTSKFVAPSSNEILNAAQRMLLKRQSNTNLNQKTEHSPAVVMGDNTDDPNAVGSVKDIKSKFENLIQNKAAPKPVQMTPRLIIKKFEELSRDNPLNGCMVPSSAHGSTTNLSMSAPLANNSNRQSFKAPVVAKLDESAINSDHITPKSIINKFEKLLASNSHENAASSAPNPTSRGQMVMASKRTNCKELTTKTPSPSNSQCTVTASLTYVSSVVSSMSVSPSFQANMHDFEDEDASEFEEYDETRQMDAKTSEDDAIYEELHSDTLNRDANTNGTQAWVIFLSYSNVAKSDN